MSVRIETDLDDDTEILFASVLMEANAAARARGEPIWTPSELLASLVRCLLEDEAATNDIRVGVIH